MVSPWDLPTTAEFGGITYTLNTDYRDILEIISYLTGDGDGQENAYIAMALFYGDFDNMPAGEYKAAWEYLRGFISMFEPEDSRPAPKVMDWEHDFNPIISGVNKVWGGEVRMVPYMHWFTFIGLFSAVGDGPFSTIVSIREKKRKGKKLEKWEQEYYAENKARVDLPKKQTEQEKEEIEKINDWLNRW